jgi:hypothetical protein
MSILSNSVVVGGAGGIDTGDIANSLRFRSAASAYLSRTFGAPTNNKIFTWSGWVKRGLLTSGNPALFCAPSTTDELIFTSGDKIQYYNNATSGSNLLTTQLFRDPTSHMHIVLAVDTTQATASDRVKLYCNGVQITSFGTASYPALNYVNGFNSAVSHQIGKATGVNYLDGYLSRVCFVDGQALTPSSFGYLNTDINEWVSKTQSEVKAVVDAGGANSFMLDFDDATSLTTLGYDKSTKGNNWALNNISLTAGVTYDHMLDVPGNSFATLNPLDAKNITLADGNLKATYATASWSGGRASMTVPKVGSWKWEVTPTTMTYGLMSIATASATLTSTGYQDTNVFSFYLDSGEVRYSGSNVATVAASSVNDVHEWRIVDGAVSLYRNNTLLHTFTQTLNDIAGDYFPAVWIQSGGVHHYNFGQRPFTYNPTGFLSLCQANLPDVDTALLNPTDHHIDITVTKSGDTNFTLPWDASVYDTFFEIKRRDLTGDWYQIDGLRGYDKILKSNSTAAETTDANVLGVSGTTCTLKSTLADGTYVISATKAGLSASRQTNTDGTITSTVSRNVDSGFAIVTGTLSNTDNPGTFGHGLGVITSMVVGKNRDLNDSWRVHHKAFSSASDSFMYINSTNAVSTAAGVWGAGATSITVGLGGTIWCNTTNQRIVLYCYADSAIQKSFSYTGNASADGPNPFLGFKCGQLTLKRTNTTGNWINYDSTRNPYNVASNVVFPNTNGVEQTSGWELDMNAMSFKLRLAADPNNGDYIGHAWAATVGKYSNAR